MFTEEKLLNITCEYHKRETIPVRNIGGDNFPVVITDLSDKKNIYYNDFKNAGYIYDIKNNDWKTSQLAADYIYIGDREVNIEINYRLNLIIDYKKWKGSYLKISNVYPLFSPNEYLKAKNKSSTLNFIKINFLELNYLSDFQNKSNIIFILNIGKNSQIKEQREFFDILADNKLKLPVILYGEYDESEPENFMIHCSGDFGSLLVDGFGDGIWIKNNKIDTKTIKSTSFGILQACRIRISKTEYISCPSCGRTLFDLKSTVEKIRKKTKHLKGLKIAIMGCIVNGLGEMADADYGYIGGAKGKVNLYMKKKLIKQNIPEENAVEELLEIIKITKNKVKITDI